MHFADSAAGRLQRGPQGGPLRPGHGAPCRRASLGAQAGIHAGQRVGKIGQSPVAMGHGQRGVLPGAAAPHQRRHQNRPGCARDEEQRVAQALDDCGRGQLGRHHEAGRQQRADDGGRRSQHAQQAAQGAAQEGQRQQQPQMGRAHAGQQAIQAAGQSKRQHGARALSQRAAGIAEAGPECRDGAPAQPGFIEQHGQDHRRRAGGGGLQGVQPEDAAHGGAPGSGEEVKLLLRSGKGPGGRGALTLPCREDRQCVFCGRSSPISRQPAGMVTHL